MADVEMQDATAPAKSKVLSKAGKPGAAEAAGDSKKKFEVKKVRCEDAWLQTCTNWLLVECRCSMGLGYRRRQLRYLP